MKTESMTESPQWAEHINEAIGILNRLGCNQGEFTYYSQLGEGPLGPKFQLIIRPMKNEEVHGQPSAHQYSDLFFLGGLEELHVARFRY